MTLKPIDDSAKHAERKSKRDVEAHHQQDCSSDWNLIGPHFEKQIKVSRHEYGKREDANPDAREQAKQRACDLIESFAIPSRATLRRELHLRDAVPEIKHRE